MDSEPEDDFELDEEIDRLSVMLSTTQGRSMDWADTMICAPRAIGIIGECLLLSSHQRAALVPLSDDRLRAKSLPANLRQCAITGKVTFDEAASRMRNISAQALMLSRNGAGVIDRIAKFASKPQTPVVARELEKQKHSLKTVVASCKEDAEALQEAFKAWNEETLILLSALNISEDEVVREVDTTATDLVNTNQFLERLKKQLGFDGMNLNEIEDRLLQRTEASRGTARVGTPLIAAGLLLKVLGASVGGPLVVGASAAIWGRAIFAGYTQIKRDKQVSEFQQKALQAQTLEQQLQKLGSASCTLDEIRTIVGEAVRQIVHLQRQVSTLLQFFKAIFKRVETLDRDQATRLEEHINDEGYRADEDIKKIMIEDALDLKICFTFIGRLANMYSEVSAKYLLPGMHTVQMLGLSDDSRTSAQREWKRTELETFKRDSVEGVRKLTIEKQDQLNDDMARLIKQGILSLRSVSA